MAWTASTEADQGHIDACALMEGLNGDACLDDSMWQPEDWLQQFASGQQTATAAIAAQPSPLSPHKPDPDANEKRFVDQVLQLAVLDHDMQDLDSIHASTGPGSSHPLQPEVIRSIKFNICNCVLWQAAAHMSHCAHDRHASRCKFHKSFLLRLHCPFAVCCALSVMPSLGQVGSCYIHVATPQRCVVGTHARA